MDINELRKENDLVDLFCNLAQVTSPSHHEEKVLDWICDYCKKNGLHCEQDDFKNIYITVPATDKTKQPILLSSHVDVIGDDSPVVSYLDGDLIRAKGRTLGADDKAGVANALYFANYLNKRKDLSHGGLEIHFTRDEEDSMSGIKNTDFNRLQSKYVLVLDSDALGQCLVAGASYVMVDLKLKAPKGGHSGNDIGDPTRANAAKLIADLVSRLPQGVYYEENGQVITSNNIGGIESGDLKVTNVINTDAHATYSIRSSNKQKEDELIAKMQGIVDEFNKEHDGVAHADITFTVKMPMFEKNDDDYIPDLFADVAKKLGITPEISSFHAGAETHIYANKTNAKGEKFSPYLLGLATVCNMHSAREYVDYKTMIKGQELLRAFFEAYNK
ncbi:MAG: M20/M25/M40 family metallo-hydrolase [Cyanobacteriota bacterium]|nr:M20/M25/M40 family metallo-hydrolase [Cyanobacteriota bacterium]